MRVVMPEPARVCHQACIETAGDAGVDQVVFAQLLDQFEHEAGSRCRCDVPLLELRELLGFQVMIDEYFSRAGVLNHGPVVVDVTETGKIETEYDRSRVHTLGGHFQCVRSAVESEYRL